MYKTRKTISIFLVVIIFLTIFSGTALAEETNKGGFFERTIASPIQNLVDTVGGWLGLSTLRELVFNETISPVTKKPVPRTDLSFGVFRKNQTKPMIKAHFFMVFISTFILLIAAIWMWLKKAISVTFPTVRASLKQNLVYFLLSFFVITMIIPLFVFGSEMTSATVGFFNNEVIKGYFEGTFSPDTSTLTDLGSAFIRFVMMGLSIYFNVIYIVRKYSLGLLFIASPVLMSLINFDITRNVAITAFKESLSQLLLPVIHSFIFWGFAIFWPDSSNLEKIIGVFIILPIADFFRSMLFGNSGLSRIGGVMGLATVGALGAAAFKGSKSFKSSKAPEDVGQGKKQYENQEGGLGGSGKDSNFNGGSIGYKVRNAMTGTAKLGAKTVSTGLKTTSAFAGAGMMAPAGPAGIVAGGYAGWKGASMTVNKAASAGNKIAQFIKPKEINQTSLKDSPIDSRSTRAQTVLRGRQSNLSNASTEYQTAKDTYGEESIQALASKQRLVKAETKYNNSKVNLNNIPMPANTSQETNGVSQALPSHKTSEVQNVSLTRSQQIQSEQNITVHDNISQTQKTQINYTQSKKIPQNQQRVLSSNLTDKPGKSFENSTGLSLAGLK